MRTRSAPGDTVRGSGSLSEQSWRGRCLGGEEGDGDGDEVGWRGREVDGGWRWRWEAGDGFGWRVKAKHHGGTLFSPRPQPLSAPSKRFSPWAWGLMVEDLPNPRPAMCTNRDKRTSLRLCTAFPFYVIIITTQCHLGSRCTVVHHHVEAPWALRIGQVQVARSVPRVMASGVRRLHCSSSVLRYFPDEPSKVT